MQIFDVAIIGGGPAGSSCAAFCALAGLRALVLEREKFPREKVCGDCLNPSCWSVLERFGVSQQVRNLPHSRLDSVGFIAIDGNEVVVDLPIGDDCEFSLKRSLFDDLLLKRARDLGAHVREGTTVTALANSGNWKIETAGGESFSARTLVGADGRNSTVARLRNLLPRPTRERVALQAHIPLPRNFGRRVVLQFLQEGYSGQAPVNESELNLCLVGAPPTISKLRKWAERHFEITPDQPWRTITPLTRSPVPCAHENDHDDRSGQRSTISFARIHLGLCPNVSRKTVDQPAGARRGIVATCRIVICACRSNSTSHFASVHTKNRFGPQ